MATRKRRRVGKSPLKTWSFLAYIAGDNDLSENGVEDIAELAEVGANQNVHAAVQIDTEGDFDGSIRYEITEPDWTGTAHRTVIDRLREGDSGDPKTLTEMLRWGLGRYRAKHRLVVIWNHGSGFRTRRRDIAFDDQGGSMDMPELRRALHEGGIGGSRPKVAIMGFDACLMNMLEVAHHFRNDVEYLVGSQQTEPADGWPYDRVLGAMLTAPAPRLLATRIVQEYIADYKKARVTDVTQSAIELTKTPAAVKSLHKLGNVLAAALPGVKAALRSARVQTQAYAFADYVDLGHLCSNIESSTALASAHVSAAAVRTAGKACVVESSSYGNNVSKSTGLSVWFPTSEADYLRFRGKYLALDCNSGMSGRGWVAMLDAYHM